MKCYTFRMADQLTTPRPELRPPVQETGGGAPAVETAREAPVEAEPQPESQVERVVEAAAAEQIEAQRPGSPASVAQTATPSKDPVLKEVEQVLEDGLKDAYLAMDPARRKAFRARGEQVATKIQTMVTRGKLKLREIWKLIADWLRMIPGVNRFFVEQEAKIKTDRIIHIAEKQKGR
jgi:hypothetical protein